MIDEKLPKIWYGGDYNPEQWDEATMEEDIRMFKLAGIDLATINVFSWAKSQPDENTYKFEWLDRIMDRLSEAEISVCLATSTAAHPAWMARKYPDVLRVTFDGRKKKYGSRHNSCPNSPTYRHYSREIAKRLADRYQNHPALVAWHVSNEYNGYCYCDNCEREFRNWLQKRYGTLEKLNAVWYTSFWGHTFYDWEDIVAPSGLSEEQPGNKSYFQTISLDYRRFQSDSLLECYLIEYEELKRVTPQIQITTNLMGTYYGLDYFKWAKHLDIVSWDNYPSIDTPPSHTSMSHDLMRGLKSGQPFMLMEQTPSQQNWQAYNALKRPGVLRLWSYQAVAHGADTLLYFQLRRSIANCEKYHGAVIEHAGHEHTRVFRESAEIGKELQVLSDHILDSRLSSKVGIVYDWENRWAIDLSSGPSKLLDYVNEVHKFYDAAYQLHIQTDMIGVEEDLNSYEVIIAPVMYMVKPGFAERVEQFVQQGGIFITTYFSGIVDEQDRVPVGGYPGELRKVLGIWAEEIDALLPDQFNQVVINDTKGYLQGEYQCSILCDLIHSEGAEVIATYGSDFYAGMPSLTVNSFGKGQAWYVASSCEPRLLQDILRTVFAEKQITPVLDAPDGVEVTKRSKEDQSFIFVLNHNPEPAAIPLQGEVYIDLLSGETITGVSEIPGRGVWILSK
ncbi:beta-galactosidase [Paenibacillus sp. sgz5001063]|uniref:beta-galactosidase n=1 Tax=Paenibacillus sp. sgz5001063 TaxID=3242474 RepID=UPI0036D32D0F